MFSSQTLKQLFLQYAVFLDHPKHVNINHVIWCFLLIIQL